MSLHADSLHNHLDGGYLLWHIEHDHPGQLVGLLRQYGLERVSTEGLLAWGRTRMEQMTGLAQPFDVAVFFQAIHEQAHRDSLKTQTLAEGLELGQETISTGTQADLTESLVTDQPVLFSVGD